MDKYSSLLFLSSLFVLPLNLDRCAALEDLNICHISSFLQTKMAQILHYSDVNLHDLKVVIFEFISFPTISNESFSYKTNPETTFNLYNVAGVRSNGNVQSSFLEVTIKKEMVASCRKIIQILLTSDVCFPLSV